MKKDVGDTPNPARRCTLDPLVNPALQGRDDNNLGDTPNPARRCTLDPLVNPALQGRDVGESLYYVVPPHPRARALGWKLYVKESDLNRYLLKQRRLGNQ